MALPGKLRFDSEDHPPASYYKGPSESPPPIRLPFQTPRPEEWVQAPEFVPRGKQLHDAFSSSSPPPFDPDLEKLKFYRRDSNNSIKNQPTIIEQPFVPNVNHFPEANRNPIHHTQASVGGVPLAPVLPNLPLPFPMLPPFPRFPPGPPPFTFVPNGYSANLTSINPGLGPPIPAIVLKKKRRRRNKEKTQSMLLEGESESCSPPVPSDPKEFLRETTGDDRTTIEEEEDEKEPVAERDQAVGGSCPDLSRQQLEMWDDFLYESIVNGRGRASAERKVLSNMQGSGLVNPAYEMFPKTKAVSPDGDYLGITNPGYRKADKEGKENPMTASMILQTLKEKFARGLEPSKEPREKDDSDKQLDLSFRPEISKYGYPQYDMERQHVTSFEPTGITSSMQSMKIRAPMVEDSLEGMHIRVNAFEDDEELELSETDCPEPSRFQKLQWAIQQKKYNQPSEGPPDRVCCTVM